MYTNAQDLQHFWPQLMRGHLLGQELTHLFTKTYHQFNDRYGYGCGVYKRLDDSEFSIEGSDAGVGFFSGYCPDSGLVVSILSNRTDGTLNIAEKIKELLNFSV
ncbi:MAG: beta-lactamase family protein [Cyanothece sp. SIO2G6]|nr:beta-lactamase family protein [Cyanothece sp. SIO2G6]